jgi:hypothetical protein
MKTKSLVLGLTLALFLGQNVRADDTPSWERFTSREGGFSVLLPGTPMQRTKSLKTPFGTVNMTMVLAMDPDAGSCYGVVYADFPADLVRPGNTDDILDAVGMGMVQGAKGKLRDTKEIKFGAHPGRELEMELPGGTGIGRARVYLVKGRLYQVLTLLPGDAAQSPEAGRFLDSFKLNASE